MRKINKTVYVIVSSDIWGNRNANRLLPKLHDHGCKIILITGRATPDPTDGLPANKKIPTLRPLWAIKQDAYFSFCNTVDSAAAIENKPIETEMLSFQRLAKRYCFDGKFHSSTCGGSVGGNEIAAIINQYADQGHKPGLILSGDVIALLPQALVDNYDCFGTHPGPLPGNGGMHCSERSEIFQRLYSEYGGPWDTNTDGPYILGSFFKLASKLDKGPVISFGRIPCAAPFFDLQETDLFMQRLRLYDALIDQMILHLPQLLDPKQRKVLVRERKKNPLLGNRSLLHWHDVPELDPDYLREWLEEGRFRDHNHDILRERRFIFKPETMRQLFLDWYWPKGWPEQDFDKLYKLMVSPHLPPTAQQAKLAIPGTPDFAMGLGEIIAVQTGQSVPELHDTLTRQRGLILTHDIPRYIPTGRIQRLVTDLRIEEICAALRAQTKADAAWQRRQQKERSA